MKREKHVGEGGKTVQTLLPQRKSLLYDQVAKANKKAIRCACLSDSDISKKKKIV